MNHDEFAFFNQQLAAMLRDGIPLEGAVRQLCRNMRRSPLREELSLLEADLAKGTPLREALNARKLPEFYRHLLLAGAQANSLPGVLTLLADYYRRASLIWTRLKGLMVYPVILVFVAFGLSLFASITFASLTGATGSGGFDWMPAPGGPDLAMLLVPMFLPTVLLGLAVLAAVTILSAPALRRRLRWRLSGFREAALAQAAAALAMLLRGGCHLGEAIRLVRAMEARSPAGRDLAGWENNLARGHAKFSEIAAGGRVFPPLFVWLVGSSGEDLASGFARAAEVYQARALHRAELLLYAALPVSILLLGWMIITQVHPLMRVFIQFMDALGQ